MRAKYLYFVFHHLHVYDQQQLPTHILEIFHKPEGLLEKIQLFCEPIS